MYGLEGILGNLVTSVATPAIGGLAGEAATDLFKDKIQDELLKEITQTTIGALSGAAVGAGLGALTGGKSGAMSGALTGAVGGGVGGYNAPQISQMFGMNQGVGAPQAGQVVPQASPMPPVSNAQMMQDPTLAAISPRQSPAQLNAVRSGIPPAAQQSPIQDFQAPIPQASPAAQPSAFKGYTNFLKQNYEPLAGGFFLGSSIGASQDTQAQNQQLQQQKALTNLMDQQRARRFSQSTWGYADGGPVQVGLNDPQISVHFPAWAQEQIQREGGLAALQPGMRQGLAEGGTIEERVSPYQSAIERKAAEAIQQQEASEGRALSSSEKRDIHDLTRTHILNRAEFGLGYIPPSSGLGSHISGLQKMATGGYINLNPKPSQGYYPLSQIASARPYPAATPQRQEVVFEEGNFARGGLLEGAGDGMSDSISANIGGKEPVKVADGEYLIPREIAHKYGPEKLKAAMAKIRSAAHAKKGQQVKQNAGKRALISTLGGVEA